MIGIGITTCNRPDLIKGCIENIQKFTTEPYKIFVVDDASEIPFNMDSVKSMRFHERQGTGISKNACLEHLDDCEHIFLFDDDCWPIKTGWEKLYIEASKTSNCLHFGYTWDTFTNGRKDYYHRIYDVVEKKKVILKLEGMPDQHVDDIMCDTQVRIMKVRMGLSACHPHRFETNNVSHAIKAHVNPCGVMLYFDKKCLEVVGGFNPEYGLNRGAHVGLSYRIHNKGFTPAGPFLDVVGSDEYFYALDREQNSDHKGIIPPDVTRTGEKIVEKEKTSTEYIKYSTRDWFKDLEKSRNQNKLELKQESSIFQQGISIIIPAHNTSRFIEECLDSIEQQDLINYQTIVGVDNCHETLLKTVELKHKYKNLEIYMSHDNVGPYVIRNSLISKCMFDNILFFDSDDVMKPNMISTILEDNDSEIIRFGFDDFAIDTSDSVRRYDWVAKGAFFCRKSIFNKVGGFMGWKCAADFEFQKRTEEFLRCSEIKDPLFYRRVRNDSLTREKSTKIGSSTRKKYHSKIKNKYLEEDLYVYPITTELYSVNKILSGKIPKIIHQIWVGPNPPPKFMKKWKEMNPEYEYILWDDKKVSEFNLKNLHLYNMFGEQWCGKSDVLRYEILYKYGGIYLDADCDPKRPLDDYLLDDDFFTCYINEGIRGSRLANGIIGCIKKHPIMNTCIQELSKIKNVNKEAYIVAGPVFFTKACNHYQLKVYPSYYFLPEFYTGVKYEGDFKPYCDHKWGTTNKLYGKI